MLFVFLSFFLFIRKDVLEAVFLDYMSLDFWSVKNYVALYNVCWLWKKILTVGVKLSALV